METVDIEVRREPALRVTMRQALRLSVILVMLGVALYFVVRSWHWALLSDSATLHYVVFLLHHGFKPYREITDNNFPASYMAEAAAMRIFGDGDLAWRMYDFLLLALATAAMALIARPLDWVAGVCAGGLLLLLPGREGSWSSAGPEQVMTTLLLVGYAAMFLAVRSRKPVLMAGMGLLGAWAGAMQPAVAPLVFLLTAIVWWVVKRARQAPGRYVLWALAGIGLAVAINVGFLAAHHSASDFLFTQRVITPYSISLQRLPLASLVCQATSPGMALLLFTGLVLALKRRAWGWERWTILLGAAVGFVSYVLQGEAFWHHRYMMTSFFMLFIMLEVFDSLNESGWRRGLAAAAILLVLLLIVPKDLRAMSQQKGTSDLTTALESDLNALGGARHLQRRVQCLDLGYGCLNSLYHLKLVQKTGFIGDSLMFALTDQPAVHYQRALWWTLTQRDPATVLVMTNEYFEAPNTFEKVKHWPRFARYLDENYTEVVERRFPREYGTRARGQDDLGDPNAYRIYILNSSPLAQDAAARLAARR